MASKYRVFLKLCKDWPLDKGKEGRDLGAFIRQQVAEGFTHGEATKVDEVYCREAYASLSRMNCNHHKILYPLSKSKGCTGLIKEDISFATSTEGLKMMQ